MHVLLSIRPEHVANIFSRQKRFEFRRKIFTRKNVRSIIIYSSRPVGKVVGEFEIAEIITAPLAQLWSRTSQHAGITEDYFRNYFSNRSVGHAISIGRLTMYAEPLCLQSIDADLKPPQSYVYVENYGLNVKIGKQGELSL